jgi:hypothetical protein
VTAAARIRNRYHDRIAAGGTNVAFQGVKRTNKIYTIILFGIILGTIPRAQSVRRNLPIPQSNCS